MKKTLAIGGEEFSRLIEKNCYYVDKTPWIKELMSSSESVDLITRPRRFGKSLFLDTIEEFLKPDDQNPGSTAQHEKLFSGLKIFEDKAFCENYMGKVPVLSISFKGVSDDSFEGAYECLGYKLVAAARNCSGPLLESPRLSDDEKARLECYRTDDFMTDVSKQGKASRFIADMTLYLAKHFGRPAVLLIDEYDVPLAKAAQHGYYEKMLRFIQKLLGPLKQKGEERVNGRAALEKTILTGCLRVSKESIFTGLNNLDVNTVCSSNRVLSSVIGFTQQEVDQLLAYYGLEARREDVKAWYDGYRFASSEIYCPWDVLNFCDKANKSDDPLQYQPGDYWTGTSGNEEIGEFLGFLTSKEAEQMQALIDGKEISFALNEQVTYVDLKAHRPADFWTLLLFTGYLTLTGPVSGEVCRARIPNEEVRATFKKRIQQHFSEYNPGFVLAGEKIAYAALRGDAGVLASTLRGELDSFVSVRDTATRARAENYYHGFLLALLAGASSNQKILGLSSNHEAGDGYADILFTSQDKLTGVVIELKHCARGEGLKAAKAALSQIREKRYARALANTPCKRIWGIGIACYGRDCDVVAGELVA